MANSIEDSEETLTIYPGCHWCAANLANIALWGNIGLFFIKLLSGTAGDSRAVVADAIHSAADVLLALILYVCLKIGKKGPDREHPYGRGSIEYMASLFVGISLSVVATMILYESVMQLIHEVEYQPSFIATVGLCVSIVGNELMFRHSLCCGRRFGSPAMIANAWENRADVYSSLAALVGVVGAQMGFLFMDPVGAILVSMLLLYTAAEMLRNTWKGALDHAVEEELERKIRDTVTETPGAEGIARMQTRAIGQFVGIDIKLRVPPDTKLSQGCAICEEVKERLAITIKRPTLITVSTVGTDGENDR
jgi:cation diffusion facilitator family transporter